MTAELLVSASPGELRAVLMVDGVPSELLVDPDHDRSRVGEIAVTRLTRLLPSGGGAIAETKAGDGLFVPRPPKGWREGARVTVRIVRDALPGKLPVADPDIALLGRRLALVVRPGGDSAAPGLTHRIVDPAERSRLQAVLAGLQRSHPLPEGATLVARRWAAGEGEAALGTELAALLAQMPPVDSAAEEGVLRSADPLRDLLCDLPAGPVRILLADRSRLAPLRAALADIGLAEAATLAVDRPATVDAVLDGAEEAALDPCIRLASGGRVIMDRTAALTAFDVDMAAALDSRAAGLPPRRLNEEAGRAIAAALRLRGVGGLCVIDFAGGRREAEAGTGALRRAVAGDAARVEIGKPSSFGLVELSRQQGRRSLADIRCEATAARPRAEAVATAALRRVLREAEARPAGRWEIGVEPQVAAALVDGACAAALAAARTTLGGGLSVRADASYGRETVDVRPV